MDAQFFLRAAAVGLAFAVQAQAQSPEARLIDECAEPCPGIEAHPVASLGSPDDPVLLDRFTSFALFGDSLIAAGPTADPGRIAVFNRQGRYLVTLGRQGGGPGEFRRPAPYAGPGDSAVIFDAGNGRLSVLGPDATVARSFPLRAGRDRNIVPIGAGRLLLAGVIPEEGADAGVVHVLEADGGVLASVGPAFDRRLPIPYAVPSYRPDHVLVMPAHAYRIEEWSLTGQRVETWARDVPWFHEWTEYGVPGGDDPTPIVVSAYLDSDGLLWVFVTVPVEGERYDGKRDEAMGPEVTDRLLDQVVEVIDLRAGRVVARQRFEEGLFGMATGGIVYRESSDSAGYMVHDLFRLRIGGNATDE